jgi:crystallin, alpha B
MASTRMFHTSVRHFAAKDFSVKNINNVIIIEGKHEERRDDEGNKHRNSVRKYKLPREYKNATVIAELTNKKDGELILEIPTPHKSVLFHGYRKIPIVCIVPESLIGEHTYADPKKKK